MYKTNIEALMDKISGRLLRGLSNFPQFNVRFIHAKGDLPDAVVVSVVRSKSFSFFWLTQKLSLSFKIPVLRIYPTGKGNELGMQWFDGSQELTTPETTALKLTLSNIERGLRMTFRSY